jgi:hypothetical protein
MKLDSPLLQIKPIHIHITILIIIYIVEQACRPSGTEDELAIVYMLVIASFSLLRPGEYTGTASNDTPFQLQAINLYVQGRHLGVLTASDVNIEAVTSMSYTSTTQKNGHRNEKAVQ